MVKHTRFWSSMAKTKPRQELDGQKWTLLLYLYVQLPLSRWLVDYWLPIFWDLESRHYFFLYEERPTLYYR